MTSTEKILHHAPCFYLRPRFSSIFHHFRLPQPTDSMFLQPVCSQLKISKKQDFGLFFCWKSVFSSSNRTPKLKNNKICQFFFPISLQQKCTLSQKPQFLHPPPQFPPMQFPPIAIPPLQFLLLRLFHAIFSKASDIIPLSSLFHDLPLVRINHFALCHLGQIF